ncbi:MAG: SH3 domain-containing protein [Leptospiraceae bacterium]|nr:SH3 domain-containing protein [Leptospiraceae bacterium]
MGKFLTNTISILLPTIFCFQLNAGELVVLSGDNVNVRSQPNMKGKVLGRLKYGTLASIQKKINKLENINGKSGKWIYVKFENCSFNMACETSERSDGWVFDAFVVRFSQFQKSAFGSKAELHTGDSIDYNESYDIFKNGSFHAESSWHGENGPIHDEWNGQFYRYDKLFIGIDNAGKNHRVFYLNDQNNMCSFARGSVGDQPLCAVGKK